MALQKTIILRKRAEKVIIPGLGDLLRFAGGRGRRQVLLQRGDRALELAGQALGARLDLAQTEAAMDTNGTPFKNRKLKLNSASILTILCIVLVLIVAITGFYVVDGTERAVVTRFGKYYKTFEPGLQFKIPFGIDKNYKLVPRSSPSPYIPERSR